MRINNLDPFVEALGDNDMYLAVDTEGISDQMPFLAVSDRREKLRKRQVALKKASLNENEKNKQKWR